MLGTISPTDIYSKRKSWEATPVSDNYFSNVLSRKVFSVHIVKEPVKTIPKKNNSNKIIFDRDEILKKFRTNLSKSMQLCEDFLMTLNKKFNCDKILMRPHSINQFEAIFIIGEDDYLSDKFKKMYSEVATFTEQHNKNKFDLQIHFMPRTANVNHNALKTDGYIFRYEKLLN